MRRFRYRHLLIPAAVFLIGVGMQGTGVPIELAVVAYVLAGLLVAIWLYGHFAGAAPTQEQPRVASLSQPPQTTFREPDLAPAAISELVGVRAALTDGTLVPTSAEVGNALASARTTIHGAGVRVSDPLINIPTSLPTDTFIERINAVIQRLREGS